MSMSCNLTPPWIFYVNNHKSIYYNPLAKKSGYTCMSHTPTHPGTPLPHQAARVILPSTLLPHRDTHCQCSLGGLEGDYFNLHKTPISFRSDIPAPLLQQVNILLEWGEMQSITHITRTQYPRRRETLNVNIDLQAQLVMITVPYTLQECVIGR